MRARARVPAPARTDGRLFCRGAVGAVSCCGIGSLQSGSCRSALLPPHQPKPPDRDAPCACSRKKKRKARREANRRATRPLARPATEECFVLSVWLLSAVCCCCLLFSLCPFVCRPKLGRKANGLSKRTATEEKSRRTDSRRLVAKRNEQKEEREEREQGEGHTSEADARSTRAAVRHAAETNGGGSRPPRATALRQQQQHAAPHASHANNTGHNECMQSAG